MKRLLLFLLCFWGFLAFSQKKIKVACIGNSVTAGYLLKDTNTESYPAQLQNILGSAYEVGNFGHSGATLLKNGHKPYFKTEEFKKALEFRPDIAVIHLGLNDTDPRNWPNYKDSFEKDYSWLINQVRQVSPNVKIFICRLTPIFNEHPRFKSSTRDWYWQIQQLIEPIAKANKTNIINLHKPLYTRPDLFPDALHPDAEGAKVLAQTVYQKITGNYGGLQLPPYYSDNMVLQRHRPIPIQGIANAGEKIKITLAGETKNATADGDGKFIVTFAPKEADVKPYELTIKSKNKTFHFKNIVTGDVWFCSGQSNMEFPLKNSFESAKAISTAGQNPKLRLFRAKTIEPTSDQAWEEGILQTVNNLGYFDLNDGWQESSPASAAEFSAVAYYFGNKISQQENIPIGLIQVAVGGSPVVSWIDRYTLEHDDKVVDVLTNWQKSDFLQSWVRERATVNLKNSKNPKQRHPYQPTYNFEAGVSHFTDFPITGMIWYQGESDTHNTELYAHLLPQMVKAWRQKWNADVPFYYMQLPGMERPSWPEFRNMQNDLQNTIPNSAMAVTMDFGEPQNVHPAKKKEIAERLALLALKHTYGRKIAADSPQFSTLKQDGITVTLSFKNAEKLSTLDQKPLNGFELVDEKGYSQPADTRISEANVIVELPKNQNIKTIRYAWQPFTTANLCNESGLPASTFTVNLK